MSDVSLELTCQIPSIRSIFFFNDTATTEIYTLSLHDALPISARCSAGGGRSCSTIGGIGVSGQDTCAAAAGACTSSPSTPDRKSTRLNSSHANISYAVFCLKKNKPHHRDERAAQNGTPHFCTP